jgi:putative SOS response-associated peptidase YedK
LVLSTTHFTRAGEPTLSWNQFHSHFDSLSGEEDWTPRYNIAPTQPVPIIRQHPKEPRRELSLVRWGAAGTWVNTCAILTTTPNAVTAAVHDRMPVILDPDSYDLWLDPGFNNVGAASEMLKPYDAAAMRCYAVSARVNHVANDDAECSAPVEVAQEQARSF